MELQTGDRVLISGECDEDLLVAVNWARQFTSAVLIDPQGNEKKITTLPFWTCHNCQQEVKRTNPLLPGEVVIERQKFREEDLPDLNTKYDLIYKVGATSGGFGPILVGGKRKVN